VGNHETNSLQPVCEPRLEPEYVVWMFTITMRRSVSAAALSEHNVSEASIGIVHLEIRVTDLSVRYYISLPPRSHCNPTPLQHAVHVNNAKNILCYISLNTAS